MIYIISILKSEHGTILYYRCFETCSESSMLLGSGNIKEILEEKKIHIVNAKIKNNNIALINWANNIHVESPSFEDGRFTAAHCGSKYVLLSKENNNYRIIDHRGTLYTMEEDLIKDMIRSEDIANCSIDTKGGNQITASDIYKIQEDEEFEKIIAARYTRFMAKAAIIGHSDITFRYKIENREVKLHKYTGSSKNIIIPSFITAIMAEAFKDARIETINLNEGLEFIGPKAFYNVELNYIEIPSTVKIIGAGAFGENRKLFDNTSRPNKDRFKLRNSKTIIMGQAI